MIEKRNFKNCNALNKAWMLTVMATMMIGCGGGGANIDANSTPSATTYLTGTFVDSPVAGLAYTTASISGTTNSDGEFTYLAGEIVTFSLGTLELGSTTGAGQVTLFDLANLPLPQTAQELGEQLFPGGNQRGPAHRVINTAILLQSLDSDANANNGIDISADVADLVTADKLNLDDSYSSFRIGGNIRDGQGLPGLLRTAVSESLLTARPALDPALALTHVLEQLGADLPTAVHTLYTQDNAADGSIDFSRTTTYNTLGKTVRREYDADGNGAIDAVHNCEYNANQQITRLTIDSGDGVPDSIYTTEYDEFGVISNTLQLDETNTTLASEAFIYDTSGRLIRRESLGRTSHVIEIWLVDNDGMRSTLDVDTDGDGSIDRRHRLQFGSQTRGDRWIVNDIDYDLDGATDEQRTRSFNEYGALLSEVRDTNMDGVADYAVTHTYDERGDELTYTLDSDGNGIDLSYQVTRNENGAVLQQLTDRDGDGIFESVRDYSFDTSGNLLQETAYESSTTPTTISIWTYDTDGNQLSYSYDADADGITDLIYNYTYNSQSQLVRWTFDRDNDGILDAVFETSGWVQVGLAAFL